MEFVTQGDDGHTVEFIARRESALVRIYAPEPRTAVKSPGTAPFRNAAR